MTNILVGRGVSSPLYILLSLFDIPLLIYFYHSYQAISEFLRQGQYSIIIYHSTIVIKNFEKWLWSSSLLGKVVGFRTIISLKFNSFTGILGHKCRTATVQKSFFKTLIFLENPWVATCYCSSTYELNTNIWNIGWFSGSYPFDFTVHTYNNKKINKSLFTDERNWKIISASNFIVSKCLKFASSC